MFMETILYRYPNASLLPSSLHMKICVARIPSGLICSQENIVHGCFHLKNKKKSIAHQTGAFFHD